MPYRMLLLAQGGGSSGRKDGSNHHKIILVTTGRTPPSAGEHNAYWAFLAASLALASFFSLLAFDASAPASVSRQKSHHLKLLA
jgi:hypothetical protein